MTCWCIFPINSFDTSAKGFSLTFQRKDAKRGRERERARKKEVLTSSQIALEAIWLKSLLFQSVFLLGLAGLGLNCCHIWHVTYILRKREKKTLGQRRRRTERRRSFPLSLPIAPQFSQSPILIVVSLPHAKALTLRVYYSNIFGNEYFHQKILGIETKNFQSFRDKQDQFWSGHVTKKI